MRIKLKELVESLQNHYQPKKCVWCGKKLSARVTDHTTFEIEGHGGIYRYEPQEWYPHYDIEYFCGFCDYFEHYTHDFDGVILGMRINKVFFDFTENKFSIIEGETVTPAGKLPEGAEFGSEIFQEYLEEVLKLAYTA